MLSSPAKPWSTYALPSHCECDTAVPLSHTTHHAGGASVLLFLEGFRTLLAREDPGAAEVRGRGSDVAGELSW